MHSELPFHDLASIEGWLAEIVRSSDDAIISKSLDGRVLSWNAAAERMFGYAAEEMIAQPITRIIPPERMDEEEAILVRLGRGERVEHLRTERLRRDGTRIQVELSISPILGEGGQLLGISKMVRDVTERVRLEQLTERLAEEVQVQNEELQVQNDELLRADERKNRFITMLAHELRNPLGPALNSLYLLRRELAANERTERHRSIIERQVRQMARLLDTLLDVARISRGAVKLRHEPLDFCELVERAAEDLKDYIAERGHKLTVQMPRRRIPIFGDPLRLTQVITNLLNNAAKFTQPGGKITLSLSTTRRQAVLRVRDTGPGIEPELLPLIFDAFTQGEQGLDRPHGGLGVGLAIVRDLVELHGGRVVARSAGPGTGAEFVVRLPLAESKSEEPESELEKAEPVGRQCRVLVVEDNSDLAATLTELLEDWGHSVRTAPDGCAALRLATSFSPDVILLDLGLPGESGYEVARALRLLPGGDAFILIATTGYGSTEHRRLGAEAGFDHYLVKPVDPEELRRLVETCGWADRARQAEGA